jgi:cell division protein FtsW
LQKYGSSHTNEVAVGVMSVFFVCLGLLLIYSTSSVFSMQQYGSQYHFFYRQFLNACFGLVLMVVVGFSDYRRFQPYATKILFASGLLLVLVWFPGLGKVVRGARRWIDLGPVNFQPSELVKVTLVFYLADRLSSKGAQKALRDSLSGYLRVWLVVAPILLLVLAQKDLGSPAILVLTAIVLLFLAGARWRHIALTLLAAIPAGGLLCLNANRWQRLSSFLNPWEDPYGPGWQLVQSLISLGKGGVFGVGLGNGTQKLFYLPDAHTDFIFSVMGEELGLVGCYVFLLLFLLFLVVGVRIALRAPDAFGVFLACGLTFLIGMQMAMNVGVALGLLPTKGMALPFLSYGGSALVATLVAVGLLISIARHGVMRSRSRA